MVKDQSTILQLDWEIIEVLPAGKFKVRPKDTDLIIVCYKAGKMKQSHISVIEWDWVKIDVNQYDMSQWRIVYRYNEYKN
jgi:translation initiation factor IF-1